MITPSGRSIAKRFRDVITVFEVLERVHDPGAGLGGLRRKQSLPMTPAIGCGLRLAAHPNPHPAHLTPRS
jgi:hypothetical protein